MVIDYTLFTDSDLEQMAKDEQRKEIRFESQAAVCRHTAHKLQTELAERALNKKGIFSGDIVTVHFSEGPRDFRYEGLKHCEWSGSPRIRLRAFTRKGKPFKRADLYRPSLLAYTTRKDRTHG